MDLQLYRVDRENYLVDFRNIGYYAVPPDADMTTLPPDATRNPLFAARVPTPTRTDPSAHVETSDGTAHSLGADAGKPKSGDGSSIGGVSGPFQFLHMACQLIMELASG